uniref:Uncharacterized protein n=1 Tax=Candidatus Kentrum sp. LPFa TaxID=2126335 RepID=A0A450X7Z7_9GAMM|nr:MAG: hypothetical protein BECKLPF1236B_GA0070989_14853 [Candidatus Kentron sp. LPFa]
MRNIVEEALHIGIQDNLVPLLPKVQDPLDSHMTTSLGSEPERILMEKRLEDRRQKIS